MDILKDLIPMRCKNCGKKLGEVKMKEGVVAIKCKCGTVNVLETKTTSTTSTKG